MHAVTAAEDGARLDLVVGDWLAHELCHALSKSAVRKLIIAGAVRLDGRALRRPGAMLTAGRRLEARIDLERLNEAAATPSPRGALSILYEDDDLIAVEKPAGMLTHAAADPRRQDLFTTVARILADRRQPAPVVQARSEQTEPDSAPPAYLGLHHRLDVETSGVVVFAKRERANAGLAQQFARRGVVKIYHAIVAQPHGRMQAAWRVENRLAPSGGGRRARMRQAANGMHAATAFTTIEKLTGALLVEARPETGRKHQIRAHLAGSLRPILGDDRYGGPSRAGRCVASRVMLHAVRLSLRHPVTGAELTIKCPYPPDFEALLACLRGR